MTTELTKAAQQALEVLKTYRDAYNEAWVPGMEILEPEGDQAIDGLESALTQRPAAQTEREAFERAALAKWGQLDFERSEAVPEMYYNQRLDDAWIGFGLAVAWLRASLPAPQQAAPESVGEPVARVELMQTGGNAGLATRIVEIDDPLRERLRPGDVLYDRPAPGVPEGFALVPMTEDQVWHNDSIMSANAIGGLKMEAVMRIVRGVEAHHSERLTVRMNGG